MNTTVALQDLKTVVSVTTPTDNQETRFSQIAHKIGEVAKRVIAALAYFFTLQWIPSFRSHESYTALTPESSVSSLPGSDGTDDISADEGVKGDRELTVITYVDPATKAEDEPSLSMRRVPIMGMVQKTRISKKEKTEQVLVVPNPGTDQFYIDLKNVTKVQLDAITNIVTTLGDENKTPGLGLMSEAPKIENLHPLVFAAVIFSDRNLTEKFAHSRTIKTEVETGKRKRPGFLSGKILDGRIMLYTDSIKALGRSWQGGVHGESRTDYTEKSKYFKRNLGSFAHKLGLNPNEILALCDAGKYDDVFDLLIRNGLGQILDASEKYQDQYETKVTFEDVVETYEEEGIVDYKEIPVTGGEVEVELNDADAPVDEEEAAPSDQVVGASSSHVEESRISFLPLSPSALDTLEEIFRKKTHVFQKLNEWKVLHKEHPLAIVQALVTSDLLERIKKNPKLFLSDMANALDQANKNSQNPIEKLTSKEAWEKLLLEIANLPPELQANPENWMKIINGMNLSALSRGSVKSKMIAGFAGLKDKAKEGAARLNGRVAVA